MSAPLKDDPALTAAIDELRPFFERYAQDPELHTKVMIFLCTHWLRVRGEEDPYTAWRLFEIEVVNYLSATLDAPPGIGTAH